MIKRFSWTLLILLLAAVPFSAVAQAPPLPTADPAATPAPERKGEPGLKVAPDRYDEAVEPGKPKDGVIDVFNVSKYDLTVQPEIENIRMVGEDGGLEYYVGENPYRLHTFIKMDKAPFVLKSGEARRIKFQIDVPVGVFPGGYFGAILMRIVPPPEAGPETTILQGGRVGTLIIINVLGDSVRQGSLKEAAITDNGWDGKKEFRILYANTGNTDQRPLGVAYKPIGTITIKNALGLDTRKAKVAGETVFPGASRKAAITLDKPVWFGRYTAEVTMGPEGTSETETKRITFWAFSPLGIALAVAVAGGIVALWFFWSRRPRQPKPAVSVSHRKPPHE